MHTANIEIRECVNCGPLTGPVLLFRTGGRLREVVAYEKWSHMEVGL